ncbi:MAG: peptidylprolyl isomerase [Acidimicrobiales bacterium]
MGTEKRERQKANRQARLEAERKQEQSADVKKRLAFGGAIVALAVAVLFSVSYFSDDGDSETTDATTDAAADTTATTAVDEEETVEETTTTEALDLTPVAPECPPDDASGDRVVQWTEAPAMCIDDSATYLAEVTTSLGDFTIELDASKAPATVNNFVFLARHHYYDGVTFHRIIPGFVVQGGDAVGNPLGTGNPGYQFPDELPAEGEYEIGSVAMANSGPDTNGSQFFVVTGDSGMQLPPQYSLFGTVTEGLDVVMAIEATGTAGGEPSSDTIIESVTISQG